MRYEIKGSPYPVVTCALNAGESVICQRGAMAWMSPNMQMQTKTGGIGKMFSRSISGESMFQNTYTAMGGPGEITFSSSVPGNIMPVQILPNKPIIAQKRAFLASEVSVDLSIFFQKRFGAGFFGGEGFIMQKLSGSGMAFIEIDGSVVEYQLGRGQSMLIDTGYLAAMDATCSISIESVQGLGNVLFGGEGLFNTRVTGPGHVWIQTMPVSQMANALSPYLIRSS